MPEFKLKKSVVKLDAIEAEARETDAELRKILEKMGV